MKVSFFDMAAELVGIRSDIDTAIARVLDAGVFIGGPEVASFERALATATGAAHAIGTSSGTDALHVIAMALGVCAGDDVVTTPFTFMATPAAFARLGARIVFADVDEQTLCLSPAAAASACSTRTRAVVTVNLFGLRVATHGSVSRDRMRHRASVVAPSVAWPLHCRFSRPRILAHSAMRAP